MSGFYKNIQAVFLLVFVLLLVGSYEFFNLPSALYPKASKPRFYVWQNTSSMDGLEFRAEYGEKIEQTLENLEDISDIEVRYRTGSMRLFVEFEWGVDPKAAKSELTVVLGQFQNQFPDHWGNYYIGSASSRQNGFYAIIADPKQKYPNLRQSMQKNILPKLNSIPGMTDVFLGNFGVENLEVTLDPDAMLQYGVRYADVRTAVNARETARSFGSVDTKWQGAGLALRKENILQSLSEVKNILIPSSNGNDLRLEQIADIHVKSSSSDALISSKGVSLVAIQAMPDEEANLREVSAVFKEKLFELVGEFDADLELDMAVDPSKFIDSAIENVMFAVLAGMLSAGLIILFFMRLWSLSMMICIAIPLSLIGGFILMDVWGIEINLISLGGMAIAVGMSVDAAVVVIEQIKKRLSEDAHADIHQSVQLAIKDIAPSILSSTLTSMIVFLPLPFTSPLTAAILGDLALVMISVLAMSIVVSLFIVPAILIYVLSKRQQNSFEDPKIAVLEKANQLTVGLLEVILKDRHKQLGYLLMTFVLLLAAVYCWQSLPRNLIDLPEGNIVYIRVEVRDDSLSIDDQHIILQGFEERIWEEFPTNISRSVVSVSEENRTYIQLFLKDDRDREHVVTRLRELFVGDTTANINVSNWSPTRLSLPEYPDFTLRAAMDNTDASREFIAAAFSALRKSNFGFTGLDAEPSARKAKYLNLQVDEVKLATLGQAAQRALETELQAFSRQDTLFYLKWNQMSYRLRLAYPESFQDDLLNLDDYLFRWNDIIIPIRHVVKTSIKESWQDHEYRNNEYLAEITGYLPADQGANFDAARLEVAQQLNQIGYSDKDYIFQDSRDLLAKDMNPLILGLFFSILLVSFLLVVQFGSLATVLVILSSVLWACLGAGFSLWLFSSKLNLNSLLGVILLAGIAVNNAILLADFFMKYIQSGLSPYQAALKSAEDRLRPILMTTLTTVVGMLPLALGIGQGANILQPLGIAVSGGLMVSTAMTLISVPLLLSWVKKPKML